MCERFKYFFVLLSKMACFHIRMARIKVTVLSMPQDTTAWITFE
jgi:hypothetical protein